MTQSSSKLSGNSLDLRGLAIIAERQRLAQNIGLHKIQHGIPVHDAERERVLLQSFCEGAEQKGIATQGAGKILERLFLASREVQQKISHASQAQLNTHSTQEFQQLRLSMEELNIQLLNYMRERAQMIMEKKSEGLCTKEEWREIAVSEPYNIDSTLAQDLYDLFSEVTLTLS